MFSPLKHHADKITEYLRLIDSKQEKLQLQAINALDEMFNCSYKSIGLPENICVAVKELVYENDFCSPVAKAAILFLNRHSYAYDTDVNQFVENALSSADYSFEFKIQLLAAQRCDRLIASPDLLRTVATCITHPSEVLPSNVSQKNANILANTSAAHIAQALGAVTEEQGLRLLGTLGGCWALLQSLESLEVTEDAANALELLVNTLRKFCDIEEHWVASLATPACTAKDDFLATTLGECVVNSDRTGYDLMQDALAAHRVLFTAVWGNVDFTAMLPDLICLAKQGKCQAVAVPLPRKCAQLLQMFQERGGSLSTRASRLVGASLTGAQPIRWGSDEGLILLSDLSRLSQHCELIFYCPRDPAANICADNQREFGAAYQDLRASILAEWLNRDLGRSGLVVVSSIIDCFKSDQFVDGTLLLSLMQKLASRVANHGIKYPTHLNICPEEWEDYLDVNTAPGVLAAVRGCCNLLSRPSLAVECRDQELRDLPFLDFPQLTFSEAFDGIIVREYPDDDFGDGDSINSEPVVPVDSALV